MDPVQIITKILRARQGGEVERCHTVPHHGTYKVAEHTFGMLLLLDIFHPFASSALRRAVLYHDLTEYWLGDLPGSVKKVDPELKKVYNEAQELLAEEFGWPVPGRLEKFDRQWLAAIDHLELFLWAHDQINLGSGHVIRVLEWAEAWFAGNRDDVPSAVMDVVDNFEWRKISGAET